MAQRFPGMRMNINHLAKPAVPEGTLEDWRRGMSAIAQCPNVFFKVSALIDMWVAYKSAWTVADAVTPFAQFIRSEAGIDRLMWASDWPVALTAGDYEDTISSTLAGIGDLSADEEAKLFGENAVSFYRL